jgi:hypothetical protein
MKDRVEWHSRYVLLFKIAHKDTRSVVSALIRQTQRLPRGLHKSLTWGCGKELADHLRLSLVSAYFCDPQSPWQCRYNENTNRLLRQYFSNGTDLAIMLCRTECRCSATQRTTKENAGIPNARRALSSLSCRHPLNPLRIAAAIHDNCSSWKIGTLHGRDNSAAIGWVKSASLFRPYGAPSLALDPIEIDPASFAFPYEMKAIPFYPASIRFVLAKCAFPCLGQYLHSTKPCLRS